MACAASFFDIILFLIENNISKVYNLYIISNYYIGGSYEEKIKLIVIIVVIIAVIVLGFLI